MFPARRSAQHRNIETRSKLRLEIRRRVERITSWFRCSADSRRLVEDPAKELFAFAEVRFTNVFRRHYWEVVDRETPERYRATRP